MGKQSKTTKAQADRYLTPPPKIVSRKCSGIEDLARLDRTREVFEADAARWKAGKWTKADLKAVFEPPLLLPIMNTIFAGLIPIAVSIIAARTYLFSGLNSLTPEMHVSSNLVPG